MRVVDLDKNIQSDAVVESYLGSLSETSPVTHKSYHELLDTPVVETDVLNQLHANIEMLADLQLRLTFVMKEVRYLLKA